MYQEVNKYIILYVKSLYDKITLKGQRARIKSRRKNGKS